MNDFLQNLRGGQRDNRVAKTRRGFDTNSQQPNFNSSSHFHSNPSYQNPRVGSVKRPMRPNPQNPMAADPNTLALPTDVVENILILAETMVRNQEFLAAAHERRAAAEERKADSLEEIAEYLRVLAVPSSSDENLSANGDIDDQDYGREFGHGYGMVAQAPKLSTEPESFQEAEPVKLSRVVQEPEPFPAAPVKKRRGRKPKALKLAEEREAAEFELREAVEEREKNKVKVIKRTRAEKMKLAEGEDGKVEIMSREAVMEIVNTMRKQGATFDEVAQRLVALGQPTFSGRGEWHAQTVHRLCNTKKTDKQKK
ncbi:MAG: hypothetical protein RBQ72_03040 [Desulfobacterium sp.]|jgi:hypothetical protein|nr:hypothetical protein [Desulfobacterium sp.]